MKLVFVINDPVVGLGLLRSASFHNYRVDVVARTGCRWVAAAKACQRFSEVDEHLIESDLANVLKKLGYDDGGHLILAAGEIATNALARAAEVIDAKTLPTAFNKRVLTLGNKAGFAEICKALALPTPKTWQVSRKEEICQLGSDSEFEFPVMIKAINMSGSIGIRYAASIQDIDAIVSDKTFDFSPLVVQKFIKGHDVGLSFLARKGDIELAYGQRIRKSSASFPVLDELFECAKILVQSNRYTGPGNIDARIDDQGRLYLIEFNTRFWATSPLSCLLGIDLIGEAKKISVGSNPAKRYHAANQPFTIINAMLGLASIGPLSQKQSLRFLRLILKDLPGFALTKVPALRPLARLLPHQ